MDEQLILNMRDRISRARRAVELAHDAEMVQLLEQMIEEAEADIRRIGETVRLTTVQIERE
jgi:hypothetical protein